MPDSDVLSFISQNDILATFGLRLAQPVSPRGFHLLCALSFSFFLFLCIWHINDTVICHDA